MNGVLVYLVFGCLLMGLATIVGCGSDHAAAIGDAKVNIAMAKAEMERQVANGDASKTYYVEQYAAALSVLEQHDVGPVTLPVVALVSTNQDGVPLLVVMLVDTAQDATGLLIESSDGREYHYQEVIQKFYLTSVGKEIHRSSPLLRLTYIVREQGVHAADGAGVIGHSDLLFEPDSVLRLELADGTYTEPIPIHLPAE